MANIKVPTLKQFKSMTGRTGIGKIFKTKSDLKDIFGELKVNDAVGEGSSDSAIASVRAVRLACITWLTTNFTERASHAAVTQLKDLSNQRFHALMEFKHFGKDSASNRAAPAIKEVPNLPFGRELTGQDVSRVGNRMGANLSGEMGSRHWGPHVHNKMTQWHRNYQNGGGTLSLGAWADFILPVNLADDPSGMFLGGGSAMSAPSHREIAEGVKYCNETERASYKLSFQGGRASDASGTLYDTTGRETHFSKYGWAIFVLGFDNEVYSNSHLVNLFHHSSFFAGNPVQCGGEVCCIAGKIRYLTPKTGHYRSGKMNFYRLLSLLSYQGVDLTNTLACPTPHANEKYWLASDVFSASGGEPTSPPVRTNHPTRLTSAGIPDWPTPPMTA